MEVTNRYSLSSDVSVSDIQGSTDLHLGNMLSHNAEMQHWTLAELEQHLGEPDILPVRARDGSVITKDFDPHWPKRFVGYPDPTPLFQFCLVYSKPVHVKICDFGESFLITGTSPVKSNIPLVFAAPEIIFHEPFGFPTDIWALAVLLHMIMDNGCTLFPPNRAIKKVVRDMVLKLGKFPERWWSQWADRAEYFDENGIALEEKENLPPAQPQGSNHMAPDLDDQEAELLHPSKPPTLVRLVPGGLSEQPEVEAFDSLVRKMVCYEMGERIPADAVVQLIPTAWLTDT